MPATSGRAKCRGCGRAIRTGELRFGEALPNPYGEGDAVYWLHVTCAACMRPEKFLPALRATDADIPERTWLESTAETGIAHRRLPRLAFAERSKSGKARCRSCREMIAGGVMRFALVMFEEGRLNPSGFIHVECAQNYLGTTDILDRVQKLSPDVDAPSLAELSEQLQHQRAPRVDDVGGSSEEPSPEGGPDLAKAHPKDVEPKRAQSS